MNGYIIALIVFLAWLALIYVLNKTKWLERHDMNLYGPMIMWRTKRGRGFIDRLASAKRFWGIYGKLSLWICAASMAIIMLLLLWEATIVPKIESPPSPELILGIPGINPIIPVGYGILGLAIAIIVHEFSHGIMSRVGGLRLKSLGLLFLVFPMGAFAEPDDQDMQQTTRSKRSKVFAAGPTSNIILALVVLSLFSGAMMSNLEPARDGALALGVVQDSPAQRCGIVPSSVIVSVDGQIVSSSKDFTDRHSPNPGALVTVEYYYAGELVVSNNVTDGIVVAYVTAGFAADNAGLEPGMVFVSVNDTVVGNLTELTNSMRATRAGVQVNLTVMSYDSTSGGFVVNDTLTHITPSDKWEYYSKYYPDENDISYHGVGFLGAGFYNLGIRAEDVSYYSDVMANPFRGDRDLTDFSNSWLRLIALPFLDLAPVRSPVTDLYHPSGSLGWMPDSVFWLLANSLYWVFWLNLMIGLTNVMPAVPLDGGYIFRDLIDWVLSKTGKTYSKEQKERIVGSVTIGIALFVLSLILWQLIGPAF
jgi:membrane-associated protease RseP (regulator of RpoE activity)